MRMFGWGIWGMSRVCLLYPRVCWYANYAELKRSFGLLGMVGFSFSVVTSYAPYI